MHPTARVLSFRVHKPLIRFLGRRTWPLEPEPQHPHPSAPAELRDSFADFLQKFDASASRVSSTSTQQAAKESKPSPGVYEHFWEAPSRIWRPRVMEISEDEIKAVISGGASTV